MNHPDPDPILDEIRAENPLREHYDAAIWEARIRALYLARRAEVLADELRRVACAPKHVREPEITAAAIAWRKGWYDCMAREQDPLTLKCLDVQSAEEALYSEIDEALDCERRGVVV